VSNAFLHLLAVWKDWRSGLASSWSRGEQMKNNELSRTTEYSKTELACIVQTEVEYCATVSTALPT
jgi:hypothetical protein